MAKTKQDKITKEKLEKYKKITQEALKLAIENTNKARREDAEEIIEMVSCYLNDARFFETQGDLVNAFAAINYAHGWLDSGARLGIFEVKNNKLFTIR